MHTLEGDLDPDTLAQEIINEDVPCGRSRTTRYFKEGRLVRQDCAIEITDRVERVEPKRAEASMWYKLKTWAKEQF